MADVEVRGRYTLGDDTPARGDVTFAPRVVAVNDNGDGNILIGARVRVSLNQQGAFAVTLQPSDDVTLTPTGWTYQVVEEILGVAARTYDIVVPTSAVALGIDLVTVAPASASTGTGATYVTLTVFDALDGRVDALETGSALTLLKAQNLADLPNAGTARTNLGLGTAAVQPATAFDAAGSAAAAQAAAVAAAAADATTKANTAQTAAATYSDDTTGTAAKASRLRNRLMQISLPVTSDASLLRVNSGLYRLSQRLVGNKWFRVDLLSMSGNPGALALHQLNQCAIDMPWLSVDHTDASAVYTGAGWAGDTAQAAAYGGSYRSNNTGTGQDVTWTSPAGADRLGVRTVAAANGGVIKVEIGGSATAANLLPTAQDLVTRGQLVASALTTGGGTLNPTDRVLDLYVAASSPGATIDYDRNFALADGLTAGAHVVKMTVTGYQNTAATGFRLYASGFTYALPTTTISTANAEMLAHTRLLSEFDSAWEYAHEMTAPGGGTTYTFVGNVHGYEAQTALTFYLDGAAVTLTDGQRATGNDVQVLRTTNLRHPQTSTTQHATVVTAYRLGIAGLQVTHETTWLTACTLRKSYPAMLPLNGKQFSKGSIGLGADYALSVNGGAYNGQGRSDVAYVWDAASDGTLAALLHLPDLAVSVNNWARSADIYTAIEDRVPQSANNGDLSKIYTTRVGSASSPVTVAVNDRWKSHAIYRVWQQIGVDRALAAT